MTDKIKKLFIWLFAGVGLLLLIIGGVQLLNLGLKTYIFTKADYPCFDIPKQVNDETDYIEQCEASKTAQKQNQAAQSLALIIVGAPVFYAFYKKTKSD